MDLPLAATIHTIRVRTLRLARSAAVRLLPLSLVATLVQAGVGPTPSASHFTGIMSVQAAADEPVRRVNVPDLSPDKGLEEGAIFWFGQVTPTLNFVDGRAGYRDDKLVVSLHVFDRRLWYDTTPQPADFTNWDTAALLLHTEAAGPAAPTSRSYQFVGQLDWWEPRGPYQVAYQGTGTQWQLAGTPFTTESGWAGDVPNTNEDDRGWLIVFYIPFSSLGLSSQPNSGEVWRMAALVYDRDDSAGTPIPVQTWPESASGSSPATWGELQFGLPESPTPPAVVAGSVTIRQGLNGAVVTDAVVGGNTDCGGASAPDFFPTWGDLNYAGRSQINIQNLWPVSDWPCLSKVYITFPLTQIPPGVTSLSARLTMHHFGNCDPSQAQPSWIQVLTIGEDWNEGTITWNNAPYAVENGNGTWVYPVQETPPWPGNPYTWDVSLPVAEAYREGQPLRLALYSADGPFHGGKYFISSDEDDWNAVGRPTLDVSWGEPPATPTFTDVPFSHPYHDVIEALYQAGYTAGCNTNPLMYCPEATMNRAESSVFVERGIHTAVYDPPAPPSQVFADMPLDSWAAKWVTGLWNDQYTAGCGTNPLIYCPWQGHTRAEGCVFYLRMLRGATYEPAQPTQQTFVDVPLATWYAKWVQAAHDAGLITACQTSPDLRFCPDGPLTRALAAYMMVRAKGLVP